MKSIVNKRVAALLLCLISAGYSSEGGPQYFSTEQVFIENITVIDGLGTPPVHGQDILITDGKIAAITITKETSTPPGAIVIDGFVDVIKHDAAVPASLAG